MAGWSVLELMKTIDPQIKELENSIAERNKKRKRRHGRPKRHKIRLSKASREEIKRILYFLKKARAERPTINIYKDGSSFIEALTPSGNLALCLDSDGNCDDFQMYPCGTGKIPHEKLLGALI